MSEMIEKAANELRSKLDELRFDERTLPTIVRIVIEAIKTPSADMLIAGRHGLDRSAMYDRDALLVWQDMINEMLK
jgi:hypothetical protein